jgi:hypothetical protein
VAAWATAGAALRLPIGEAHCAGEIGLGSAPAGWRGDGQCCGPPCWQH